MNLPTPECRWGYTEKQLLDIIGDDLTNFRLWMNGQTQAVCEGRAYDHDKQEYYEVCNGVHHGLVVYSWDLERYLEFRQLTDTSMV